MTDRAQATAAKVRYRSFDPLLPAADAEAMMRLCEDYGSYGMYGRRAIEDGIGAGLAQRHDAAANFLRTGGRFGRLEDPALLAVRTNYFRETYAYDEPVVSGIEGFLRLPAFFEAAREVSGAEVIKPNIVYANILAPGQELGVHTDVPEFRGMNRTKDPEWLLVAMLHSGLFDRWRITMVTAVAWFGSPKGGEFCFYPDGKDGSPRAIAVRHNTAILLDTDLCFHGVDRVVEPEGKPMPPFEIGMELSYEGEGRWRVGPSASPLARYRWEDLRFSVSWKAYCYADEAERRMAEEHSDDIERDRAVARLIEDMRERGSLGGSLPDQTQLGLEIIKEYIKFPSPRAAAAA